MSSAPGYHAVQRVRTVSRLCAGAVAVFAVSALLGWAVRLRVMTSFGVGRATTSVATAICLVLSAAAAFSLTQVSLRRFRVRPAGGTIVLVVGLYCLAEYVAGRPDAGYLLGRELGRLSPATAAGFIVLGAALLATDVTRHRIAVTLATLGLIVCLIDLVGYAYGIDALYRVFPFSAMSLPTALAQGALLTAVLLARPDRGWIQFAIRGGHAGTAFRLLMPAVLMIPLVCAGGVLMAVESHAIEAAFGFAVLTVAMIVILGTLVCLTCTWLLRIETVNDRLAAIVASSSDAIIGESLDGIITSWNGGAEHLFGYRAEEAIGRSKQMLLPAAPVAEQIRRATPVTRLETVCVCKSGTPVDVSVTMSPIRDEAGEAIGMSSIMRDITELKRRGAELERSIAELEQFAYVASHDLQEPLRIVANFTQLLADRYRGRLDERADRYLHFASDGARRMQRLVSGLLAYARLGSQGGPLAPVDVDAVLRQVDSDLRPMLQESGVSVEYGPLPVVLADEMQLGQVFQNLISNAVKFRSDRAPRVTITAEPRGQDWVFAVADNGIGIDRQHADRIFQMFQRLHGRDAYEGSGIGLAVVKRIVERHGGRIWLESTPGEGATFRFTLHGVPATVHA